MSGTAYVHIPDEYQRARILEKVCACMHVRMRLCIGRRTGRVAAGLFVCHGGGYTARYAAQVHASAAHRAFKVRVPPACAPPQRRMPREP